MNPLLVAAAGLIAVSAFPSTPARAYGDHRAAGRAVTVHLTFRLHVVGRPATHTTFWVAYGPLADRWGVVQLRAAGGGNYTAQHTLPAVGHTVFAYLAGHKLMTTVLGRAPGNPVITIRRVGPISASRMGAITVHWHVPIG